MSQIDWRRMNTEINPHLHTRVTPELADLVRDYAAENEITISKAVSEILGSFFMSQQVDLSKAFEGWDDSQIDAAMEAAAAVALSDFASGTNIQKSAIEKQRGDIAALYQIVKGRYPSMSPKEILRQINMNPSGMPGE